MGRPCCAGVARVAYGRGVTRIVAGLLGGRRLAVPAGERTRPTSDRVREALFSALESLTDLAGARFLDLYAGSGAVGLEAVSRGAAGALLVESDARVARTARENTAVLGLSGAVEVRVGRAATVVATGPDGPPFDVVFADPPYAVDDAEVSEVLSGLVGGGWLASDAVVVVERSSRSPALRWVPGITAERSRRYGETTLWYGRRS